MLYGFNFLFFLRFCKMQYIIFFINTIKCSIAIIGYFKIIKGEVRRSSKSQIKTATKNWKLQKSKGSTKNLMNKQEKEICLSFSSEYSFYKSDKSIDITCNLRLTAPELNEELMVRPSVDIVGVVDISGSMAGGKISLVKESLKFIIEEFQENDCFGIIVYGSEVEVVFPLTKMTNEAKKKALERVGKIETKGMTNLSGGLKRGLDMMRNRILKNEISSILFFTDGLANIGLTTTEEIVNMITGKRQNSKVETEKLTKEKLDEFNLIEKTLPYTVKTTEKIEEEPVNVFTAPTQQNQNSGFTNLTPPTNNFNFGQPSTSGFNFGNSFNTSNFNPPPSNAQQQQPHAQLNFGNNFNFINTATEAKMPQVKSRIPFVQKKPEKRERVRNTFLYDYTQITSINTFGFGVDVDAFMLGEISRKSNGMYYHVKNASVIGECFVNCFAGILSSVGTDLEVVVESKNGCEIKKIVTDYNVNEVETHSKFEVSIKDIQSEEKKDLFFVVKIPDIGKKNDFKFNVFDAKLTYKNSLSNKTITKEIRPIIGRMSNSQKVLVIDKDVDEVRNRLLCSNALTLANFYAISDNFAKSRNICSKTMDIIRSSPSGDSDFSGNLIQDLKNTREKLKDKKVFFGGGQQSLLNIQIGHGHQRVADFNNSGQMNYSNNNRARMFNRYKNKK